MSEWIKITEAESEIAAVKAYAPGVGILDGDYIGDGMIESHVSGHCYFITHWAPINAGALPMPKD